MMNARVTTKFSIHTGICLFGFLVSMGLSDCSAQEKHILFYGNSITAGLGIDEPNAFPALIQEKIQKTGLRFRSTNAGLSGETTSGGLRRLDWILKQQVDVIVIELGANDGLRGIPLDLTEKNIEAMITKCKSRNPSMTIILAAMEIPPNMGKEYTTQFRRMFRTLADRTGTPLIPFLLEGVGDQPSLNQADGIHPTAEGHKRIAETVWKVLQPLLLKIQ